MDIAWYLFAFVWLYTPGLFVLVSLLLVGVFFWRRNPIISRLFFCQWLPLVVLFGLTYFVWLQKDTGAFESVAPIVSTAGLVSMLMFWWLSRRMTKIPVVCALSWLAFMGVALYMAPGDPISGAVDMYRERQATALLARTDWQECAPAKQADDPRLIMHALELSADMPQLPSDIWRCLAEQAGSPFGERTCDTYVDDTPFYIAIRAQNIPAIRVFAETFSGDTPRIRENRCILARNNPLNELIYLKNNDDKNDREISDILLRTMPELLTQDLLQSVILYGDSHAVNFATTYRQPEEQNYRLAALAKAGQVDSLLAELKQQPDRLQLALPTYGTLWAFIVNQADATVIRAVLDSGTAHPAFYLDQRGHNAIIDRAVSRVSQWGEDKTPLVIIMQDILTRKIPWTEQQVLDGINSSNDTVLEAFLSTGLSCQQLVAMNERHTQDSNIKTAITSNVNRVCATLSE